MARRGGWSRKGRKGRFRYYDSRGKQITDAAKLARIEELVIRAIGSEQDVSELSEPLPEVVR